MAAYVALLRAVNVGGTGMLPMKDLVALCTKLGFQDVRTYIQTGNVVFKTGRTRTAVKESLEHALEKHMGKAVDVIVRDAAQLRRALEANPFPKAEAARVAVLFFAEPVNRQLFAGLAGPDGEEVVAGAEEVYVHYPQGMGRSKLKLPKISCPVTVRNINTVRKLVAMAEQPGR